MSGIPKALEGWLILIVDDEPDNVDVARRLLRKAGAEIITRENGREALALLQTQRPEFILCDLSMPEMDGWVFIQELRRNPNFDTIPIIALTAHAMPGDRARVLDAGFMNYITKPLSVTAFIPTLVDILADVPALKARLPG